MRTRAGRVTDGLPPIAAVSHRFVPRCYPFSGHAGLRYAELEAMGLRSRRWRLRALNVARSYFRKNSDQPLAGPMHGAGLRRWPPGVAQAGWAGNSLPLVQFVSGRRGRNKYGTIPVF